jgi:polyferredoxin
MPDIYLADIIAIIHLGYVIFVIMGFIVILAGIALRWDWVRNLWFRIIHLVAIAAVAAEALLGINCPLTVLEFRLRHGVSPADRRVSFVGDMIDRILYYDAPMWLFAIIYTAFAILVAVTFILAPPTRKGRSVSRNRGSASEET